MNHKYMTDEHKKKISESCKKNGVGKWMIGKKPSLENIEKRRNSMKGYNPSQETREKLRMAMLGKKLSHETIEKLKKSHTGIKYINRKSPKPFSIEHRIKIGKYSTGELNHNWKGGITPLRKQIRENFRYRQWRSDVFQRDNYTCILCNQKGGILNADHIKPFSLIITENGIKSIEDAIICEELWNINNGRTLCVKCHRATETYGNRNKKQNLGN